jgi:hypothetical protein
MMLVASVFPKEKSDKIIEKWEKWKISREEKRTEKQDKPDNKPESEPEASDDLKQKQEPVLKNIFIRKFSLKKEKDINETEKPEENILREIPDEETNPEYMPESFESLENEPEVNTDIADDEIIIDEMQEIQPEDSYETGEEREPVTELYEELQTEEKQKADYEQKLPDDADNSEQYENSQGFLAELGENTEKNVDTSDIIDKMGIDTISDSIELSSGQLSIDELLDQAFLLKQEGKELEAASLYINALNMKPDTKVAFWIVLDICVIYKNFGQSDLAADILQAYIDEYDDLMSNDVKEQILQSLYF